MLKDYRVRSLQPKINPVRRAISGRGLGQMQEEARGDLNLNQTAIGGIPGNRWRHRYDPTGNGRHVEIEKVGCCWSLENRVHDKGNRLMQVDRQGQSQQPPVEVDAAGRMTKATLP